MSEYDRLRKENDSLKDELDRLRDKLRESETTQRDDLARQLANRIYLLVIGVLILIGAAIGLRFLLEYSRLHGHPVMPRGSNDTAQAAGQPAPATPAPAQPGALVSATAPYPEARKELIDYIDRPATGSGGGNSYSISLSGLEEMVNTLKETAKLPVETAVKLTEELGRTAIATGGEITKDAAKALINRYLGPPREAQESRPATLAGTATAHQVQVNVYTSERRIVTSTPQKPAAPAKPKPPCPPRATPNPAPACHVDPARQSG